MSKKRHTRAPYEIHDLESLPAIWQAGMVKKDISMLIHQVISKS